MEEKNFAEQFDSKIMIESWGKAIKVNEHLISEKIVLSTSDVKDMALSFFSETMNTIREAKNRRNYG